MAWTGRLAVAAVTFAAASGCGDGAGPQASGVTVVDSAGVRVVTNATAIPPDTVRPELLWEYGRDDSEYPFQFVVLGTVASDGSAVVADAGNREVLRIQPDGATHTLLARSGQGPREVSSPRQVVSSGDLVWVEDVQGGKLLGFRDDTIAATVSVTDNPLTGAGLMPIGADPQGRLMLTTGRYRRDFEEPWLNAALATFDPQSGLVDTVGAYPMARRAGDPPMSPFGPYGVIATSTSSFITGRTDISEVTWRRSDGVVTQVARWASPARFPTDDDWGEFRSSMAADLERVTPQRSGAALDALIDDVLGDYELDPSEPTRLFDNIYGTESGAVWVAPFMASRGIPSAYAVMSSSGTWLARVEFSRPFRFVYANDQVVLGVHTDDFDVQTVAAYQNPFGM